MFKLLATLFRARAGEAAATLADAHAITLLGQQIRDAGAEIDAGKRALALAMVRQEREKRRSSEITGAMQDLEGRAVEAIAAGREDLAEEAAQAIAALETERAALATACETAAKDIATFNGALRDAARRLADLERGRRLAGAAEGLARLKARPGSSSSAIAAAERTLQGLRARQVEASAVDAALSAIDAEPSPAAVIHRLQAQGFGPPQPDLVQAILARLHRQARQPADIGSSKAATAALMSPAGLDAPRQQRKDQP